MMFPTEIFNYNRSIYAILGIVEGRGFKIIRIERSSRSFSHRTKTCLYRFDVYIHLRTKGFCSLPPVPLRIKIVVRGTKITIAAGHVAGIAKRKQRSWNLNGTRSAFRYYVCSVIPMANAFVVEEFFVAFHLSFHSTTFIRRSKPQMKELRQEIVVSEERILRSKSQRNISRNVRRTTNRNMNRKNTVPDLLPSGEEPVSSSEHMLSSRI
mmetsp:Transcript_2338/g.4934  ORF Transcript_2338/g.4934 Transcript_2338/m.4934 type:complete len:210 (-) Transcript_2338:192-821(-)